MSAGDASTGAGAERPLALPMVVAGKRFRSRAPVQVLAGRVGEVEMPAFTAEAKDAILSADRHQLVDVPIHDIVSFLNRVGKNWRSEDYSRRRLFVRQMQAVLGYSEAAAEHEADWIGAILTSHARMLDLIEVELGSRFIVDDWVRVEEALVRAYPVGLVVHILPGNVATSTLASLLRALLTKNVSVLKVASGDPVTPVSLALSFAEVDPDHPVSRAVNVVYWPEGDPLGDEVVRSADAVCAWGSASAIEWARSRVAAEASFVPFGPKRSMALVGKGADLAKAASGLAHDVSAYDQAACFSMQRVFVDTTVVDDFLVELESALRHYEELLPPQRLTVDEAAQLNAQRTDLVFGGAKEYASATRAAILVAPPDQVVGSPLGHTILVHPVDDLRQAYEHVDHGVQTVAAAPWELLAEHRHALAVRGVSRFVELGLAKVFRVGGSHDGMRPLQRLVRFVSQEAPVREIPKGMVLPLDLTKIIENRSFQDVVF